MKKTFSERQKELLKQHQDIIERKNKKVKLNKNGIFDRYQMPRFNIRTYPPVVEVRSE